MSLKHYENGSEFPELEKGKLRLYSMQYCPYVERCILVLAAKKIPHQTININLSNKPDWFISRTPTGTVPVLEHDDGRILYESLIICDYLDTIYPEHPLWPANPFEKAKQKILIDCFSDFINPFWSMVYQTRDARDELNKSLDYFEDKLDSKFFGGENAGMLDYMMWPWFERIPVLNLFVKYELDAERIPKLTAWIKRMLQVPAVEIAITKREILLKYYEAFKTGDFQYDLED